MSKLASKIGQKKESGRRIASAVEDRAFTAETAEAVSESAVAPSLRAGQYVRLTLTVRPDQLERIRRELPARWAAEMERATGWPVKVSALEIGRWLLDVGLAEWDEGHRPPTPALRPRSESQ